VFLLIDIAYLLALPFVLLYAIASRLRGHAPRKDLAARLGIGDALEPHQKRVLIHAVSVGEVNAIRTLVRDLQSLEYDVVVCVTTDTGIARAEEVYGDSCHVARFPFDFSFSIRKFLTRIKPTVIALVELEVWPNLVSISAKRNIPIVVINGRLSERSFKRYKLAKPFLYRTFHNITATGMQTELYADRAKHLGAKNVTVKGTMKWDNALISVDAAEAKSLARDLHIDNQKPLVVAGSTAPGEHELLKQAIPEGVQLLVAPRRPEWFDDAGKTFPSCNRRSKKERKETEYFLLDTIGELDKAYALADIVVVGRSFAPMHGSDPTQPIALGKPTIIGPNVSDFEEMVQILVQGKALIQCEAKDLAMHVQSLLDNDDVRDAQIKAGNEIIAAQQGATERYKALIVEYTPDA